MWKTDRSRIVTFLSYFQEFSSSKKLTHQNQYIKKKQIHQTKELIFNFYRYHSKQNGNQTKAHNLLNIFSKVSLFASVVTTECNYIYFLFQPILLCSLYMLSTHALQLN